MPLNSRISSYFVIPRGILRAEKPDSIFSLIPLLRTRLVCLKNKLEMYCVVNKIANDISICSVSFLLYLYVFVCRPPLCLVLFCKTQIRQEQKKLQKFSNFVEGTLIVFRPPSSKEFLPFCTFLWSESLQIVQIKRNCKLRQGRY